MTEHGYLRYKPLQNNLPTFVPNNYDHKFECRIITIDAYNMIGNWNIIIIQRISHTAVWYKILTEGNVYWIISNLLRALKFYNFSLMFMSYLRAHAYFTIRNCIVRIKPVLIYWIGIGLYAMSKHALRNQANQTLELFVFCFNS